MPFFVIDRTYGNPGAQPAQVFLRALEMAHNSDIHCSQPA